MLVFEASQGQGTGVLGAGELGAGLLRRDDHFEKRKAAVRAELLESRDLAVEWAHVGEELQQNSLADQSF